MYKFLLLASLLVIALFAFLRHEPDADAMVKLGNTPTVCNHFSEDYDEVGCFSAAGSSGSSSPSGSGGGGTPGGGTGTCPDNGPPRCVSCEGGGCQYACRGDLTCPPKGQACQVVVQCGL